MKKFFYDPRLIVAALLILFGIMSIDTMIIGANSWYEMAWWSKIAMSLFGLILLVTASLYMFIPFGKYIISKFKK